MSKSESLKDGIAGGLNGLLSSTIASPQKPASSPKASTKRSDKKAKASEPKDTFVYCNYLISKSTHDRMKHLAIEKNISLRQMVNEAMLAYLKKNEK
jgi:hypothetical protein